MKRTQGCSFAAKLHMARTILALSPYLHRGMAITSQFPSVQARARAADAKAPPPCGTVPRRQHQACAGSCPAPGSGTAHHLLSTVLEQMLMKGSLYSLAMACSMRGSGVGGGCGGGGEEPCTTHGPVQWPCMQHFMH